MSNNIENNNIYGLTEKSTLKEYYVKLERLYDNAVNMLTAINQSLSTSASEVTLNVLDTDDTKATVKIPSFIYLENKLEQLSTNFDSLFDIPKTGEAWFTKSSDMYKLELLKSNSAPITPIISNLNNLYTSFKDNTFVKDLVNPKMFIKLDISNLPDNISEMYVKKYVFFDKSTYDSINNAGLTSYQEYEAALFNMNKGVDYEEYDSTISLPTKQDLYQSEFKILEVIDSYYTDEDQHEHLRYELHLDTITYTNQEDSTIEFTLRAGDYISLENEYCIYKVLKVNSSNISGSIVYDVIIEEYVGHIALQTYDENQNMLLQIYNDNYDKYHYVEVPLEENPYVAIFLSTLQNNVRSIFSEPILLDLNSIYMKDSSGNYIYDNNSTPLTYIQYYNKYCSNIGDLIDSISKTAYPQLTNFSSTQLNLLQNGTEAQGLVTNAIDPDEVLEVVKINSHLIDDETSKDIISLHKQKSDINSQLTNVQSNIDLVYNQLTTTDFSNNTNVTQLSLKTQLNEYYEERLTLQKQLLSIIDNINSLSGNVSGTSLSKFRIRGTVLANNFTEYLHSNISDKVECIGLDVEYKYKSTNSDTNELTNINSSVFTDWNRLELEDRQRMIKFDSVTNSWSLDYVDYNSISNIIKWNQIDIPIQQGEDVVIRIRFKYNVGQPFVTIFSPWSDEITMTFPEKFTETSEISSILENNELDTEQAKFTKELINGGYQDHVSNKIIDNSQTFYHMPENIYSGFNTAENNLISLKDKLLSMNTDLEEYKNLIKNQLNSQYKVYLEWDNNSIELSQNTNNNIVINDSISTQQTSFVKKKINIVIKNTGDVDINLYSIFPGNVNTPLLLDNEIYYKDNIVNYERVPLIIGDSKYPATNHSYQTLGQWIYFRELNKWTNKSIFLSNETSNTSDKISLTSGEQSSFLFDPSQYIKVDNLQAPLAYKAHTDNYNPNTIGTISINDDGYMVLGTNKSVKDYSDNINDYIYNYVSNYDVKTLANINKYILRYEDVAVYKDASDGNIELKFMTEEDNVNDFVKKNTEAGYIIHNFSDTNSFCGGFLIPELDSRDQIICDNFDDNQYITLTAGSSLSIPLTFEYFLDNTTSIITKSIYFDLRPTVLKNPDSFIVTITAENSSTFTSFDASQLTTISDLITTSE